MLENIFKMQLELNDYVFKKNNIKDKLGNDLNLLSDRIFKLDKHFDLARKDLDEIKISHRKIENRGNVITSIDVNEKKQLSD